MTEPGAAQQPPTGPDFGSGPLDIRPLDWAAIIVFVALSGVVFLQFFTRYVLNDSLGWTEEIARYLLIALAFAGSVTAVRKGEHIFLEFVYRLSPPANAKPMAVFVETLSVAYYAALAALAALLAVATEERMVSIDLPKGLVYGFVAVTLAAAAIYVVQRLFLRLAQSPEDIRNIVEDEAVQDGSE